MRLNVGKLIAGFQGDHIEGLGTPLEEEIIKVR